MGNMKILLSVTVIAMLTLSVGVAWANEGTVELDESILELDEDAVELDEGILGEDAADDPLAALNSSEGMDISYKANVGAPVIGLSGFSPDYIGVYGRSDGNDSTDRGVYGRCDEGHGVDGRSNHIGVYGKGRYGGYFTTNNPSGMAVRGYATATSGNNYGVRGSSRSPSGFGGYFYNSNATGGTGVYGEGAIYGVRGKADLSSWSGEFPPPIYGVYGEVNSPAYGTGVYGSANTGVQGDGTSTGVSGFAANTRGRAYGVFAMSMSTDGAGVYAMGKDRGADLILGGNANTGVGDDGKIFSDPNYVSSDIYLVANDGVRIDLDNDGNGEDSDFEIRDKDNNLIFNVDESGEVCAKGSFSSGGCDVAEYFPASECPEPGTVMVIDPSGGSKLRCSTIAYDTTVAGIVSTEPGVSLGTEEDGNDGESLIAVAGRVPCKVDATYASIEAGDLLTTSDTPGHAMKATNPAIGTILGKALEPLDSGAGVIEVLVTLQ